MTTSKCLKPRGGSHRDRQIIAAIERHKVLTTEQIECLFFSGIKYGKRMAQRRLKRLYDTKRIKRTRLEFDQPYHYYTNRPKQLDHTTWINWVYVWMKKKLKRWEELQSFQTEADYRVLRSDAVIGVKNTITAEIRIYFVEVDLAHNAFDKVQKYNRLYAENLYMTTWWAPLVKRFPAILVFTTRVNAVEEEIRLHNLNGLEFRVYPLDITRKECLN